MNLQNSVDLYCQYPVKKRYEIAGLKISIETPKGDIRKGVDQDGHEWKIRMKHDYGYVRMSEGVDGDHVDCFIGPNLESDRVFIVHQNDPTTGEYDEDKVMLGWDSPEEAKAAYLAHYDRKGFFGSMDEMSMEEFKEAVLETKDDPKKIEAVALFMGPIKEPWRLQMDVVPTFHPPSLKDPIHVPVDHPTETDDRFMDVTRRAQQDIERFRARLTSNKGYPLSIIRVHDIPVKESIAKPYGTIYVGRR